MKNDSEIQFLNEENKVYASLYKKTSWETIRCLLYYTEESLVETEFFENFIKETEIPEIHILFFDSIENFDTEKFLQDFKIIDLNIKDLFIIFNKSSQQKNVKYQLVGCFKNCLVTETNNPFINNTLNTNIKYDVVKLITNPRLINLFKNEKLQ